jgi:hypothetical protein
MINKPDPALLELHIYPNKSKKGFSAVHIGSSGANSSAENPSPESHPGLKRTRTETIRF